MKNCMFLHLPISVEDDTFFSGGGCRDLHIALSLQFWKGTHFSKPLESKWNHPSGTERKWEMKGRRVRAWTHITLHHYQCVFSTFSYLEIFSCFCPTGKPSFSLFLAFYKLDFLGPM